MVDKEIDVLIVGGGLIGAVLLQALIPSGLRCMMVDNQAPALRLKSDFDARSLALSAASVRILTSLGLWPQLEAQATPIEQIHVSEQGRFGNVLLQAEAMEALGYVVEHHDLNRILYQKLKSDTWLAPATVSAFDPSQKTITIETDHGQKMIRARLFVAADGANSCMRDFCQAKAEEKHYPQQALIANIGLARPHQQIAYERFTQAGPMAMLPMTESRSSLVWCLSSAEATRLCQVTEAQFLSALQQQFGYRLGRLVKVGQRTCYPLRQIVMPKTVFDPVVFIGNAAHTLHPVAGQGFNLGLRDVAMLAQYLTAHSHEQPMLQAYQQARQHDQTTISRLTDGLVSLFTSQYRGLRLARSCGLVALDNNLCLQGILSQYTRGYAGVVSDLICGIPLTSRNAA